MLIVLLAHNVLPPVVMYQIYFVLVALTAFP